MRIESVTLKVISSKLDPSRVNSDPSQLSLASGSAPLLSTTSRSAAVSTITIGSKPDKASPVASRQIVPDCGPSTS